MSVAHGAVTESAEFSTVSPFTFSHTPSGTPKGVLVGIVQNTTSTDRVSAVTYGGVAMTRIATIADAAGEPGRVYVYGLHASIPTGTQTVSITHSGGADQKLATVTTQTSGGGDTEIVDFETSNNEAGNISVTIDTGSRDALIYMWVYSGRGAPSNIVPIAGYTTLTTHDFTDNVTRSEVETALTSGSRAAGYTVTASDAALVAVAISEVVAASTQAPRSMHQFRLRRQ